MTLLALFSPVLGQIDPRAEPFLSHIVKKSSASTRILDYTLCSNYYDDMGSETCSRAVMDFVNRRMMVQTLRSQYETGTFKMLYLNGRATVTDAPSEEPRPLPKDQADILGRSFDFAADFVRTGGALPDAVLSASYDGVVKYGEVISGEQITARVIARSFILGNASLRRTTMRFIFGTGKRLLAFTSEAPGLKLLHVLAKPDDKVLMRRFISGDTYRLERNRPIRWFQTHITRYRVNEPLDEALFRLE